MNPAAQKSSNWKAWRNVMPGSAHSLHVTGDVIVPTSGYSANLSEHHPQGFNPQIYLLDLTIVPPTPGQPVSQVVTTIKVAYEKKTEVNYASVTILPDNVSVPVETVS